MSEPPYDELLRCLENDWNISASWDGLRKFWLIGLTEEGVRLRDVEQNSRAERTCKEFGSVRVWQSCNVWSHELSCGHEVDTLEAEPPNYCPNCGALVIS